MAFGVCHIALFVSAGPSSTCTCPMCNGRLRLWLLDDRDAAVDGERVPRGLLAAELRRAARVLHRVDGARATCFSRSSGCLHPSLGCSYPPPLGCLHPSSLAQCATAGALLLPRGLCQLLPVAGGARSARPHAAQDQVLQALREPAGGYAPHSTWLYAPPALTSPTSGASSLFPLLSPLSSLIYPRLSHLTSFLSPPIAPPTSCLLQEGRDLCVVVGDEGGVYVTGSGFSPTSTSDTDLGLDTVRRHLLPRLFWVLAPLSWVLIPNPPPPCPMCAMCRASRGTRSRRSRTRRPTC